MKIKFQKWISLPMSVGITLSAHTDLTSSVKMGYATDERTVLLHRKM